MTAAGAAAAARPQGRWGRLAERVAAATPAGRDRVVDGVRAASIGCVVLGHWLVTAVVVGADGGLALASPLAHLPGFAALTWVLQVLGLFFAVGGYANAASLGSSPRPYRAWLGARARRLGRPVAAFLAAWLLAGAALLALGVPAADLRTVGLLVVQPLWFLAVYLAVTALTPLALAAHRRAGLWAVAVLALVVALVDLARFGLGVEAGWVGWLSVLPGWLVAAQLGVAWQAGALGTRRAAAALALGGGLLALGLVALAGYPASMVGVTGAVRSNLNPPSLLVPAVSCLQIGLVLLARERLAGWLRRPSSWAAVALVNLSAMTVFLWHQTALVAVTLAALPAGPLPGLHDRPETLAWVLARLAWLPAFAAALALLWAGFRRFERG